ncbi:hypothetical protein COO60DRAFT_1703903 [Scenedesmus sp. NREL 46B-D3]|nr:hypothetical protein COO60DRAFT_1703903 [Scenedesmus sp. NREL 46B-D3]
MTKVAAQTLTLLLLCNQAAAAARVVQLVAENPSPFVSAHPDDPKFIVSLFDDEDTASLLPEAAHTRSTLMTNAAGRQFNCSIPASPPGASTAVSQLDADMTPAYDLVKSPFELLEALDGMCLYRQDGLWTYEVCHRQQVRQFRQEAGKKAEDFSCGRYTGDERQSEVILEDLSSSGHPLKYVSHKFSGGASCVLTGRARTAEVRYTCTRGSQDNVVLSVREFPTCNYVLVVSTPFLCKHPSFEPPEEDIRVMSCVPLDAQSGSDTDSQPAARGKASTTGTAGAAALKTDQAGKDAAAARGGAAAGLIRRRKRPHGANRSPEYIEAADEGDELLLLRPQLTDEQQDEYDQDYMPMPFLERELDEDPQAGVASSGGSTQQQQEVHEAEEARKQDKDDQQQQQQQQQQQVAEDGARDEL